LNLQTQRYQLSFIVIMMDGKNVRKEHKRESALESVLVGI